MVFIRNKFLTSNLLKKGYRYHKLRKPFFKTLSQTFRVDYHKNIALKTFLQQGISEPYFMVI